VAQLSAPRKRADALPKDNRTIYFAITTSLIGKTYSPTFVIKTT
jgi:hypothetical protein